MLVTVQIGEILESVQNAFWEWCALHGWVLLWGEEVSLGCHGQEPLQRPHAPSTILNSRIITENAIKYIRLVIEIMIFCLFGVADHC